MLTAAGTCSRVYFNPADIHVHVRQSTGFVSAVRHIHECIERQIKRIHSYAGPIDLINISLCARF